MNILVLCYEISPTRGSEYAVAWNYVTQMSKYHNLTVLYGASGNHMGDCVEMNNYATTHELPHVTFHQVVPSKLCNILNYPNQKGYFGYSFYWAYHVWHKLAFQKAVKLCEKNEFDVIHFLCPIGYREPGYLWKLNRPYVWGPIGGTNNPPLCLFKALPLQAKIKYIFKTIANTLQFHYKRNLRQALTRTDVLFTATSKVHDDFIRVHKKNNIYLPENGILGDISLDETKFNNPEKYRLILVGRLDAGKAVIVLLNAVAKIQHKEKLIVDIVGDGPQVPSLQKYVKRNGIENLVVFHGSMPRDKVIKQFNKSHLHAITSISEGNPTVLWEAMSKGVPTLTLDHCGMHDVVCDQCGIRIPLDRYDKIIDNIAKSIDNLLERPERFKELAEGTINCAQKFKWENRIAILNKSYHDAISLRKQNKAV